MRANKNHWNKYLITFAAFGLALLAFIFFNKIEIANKIQSHKFSRIAKNIREKCGFDFAPMESYLGLRCDMNNGNRFSVGSVDYAPCITYSKHPLLSKTPYLYETKDGINRLVPYSPINALSTNLVEKYICAAKNGDQIAALELMVWSQVKKNPNGNMCVPYLEDIITGNNNCQIIGKEEEAIWKTVPDYQTIWGIFKSQINDGVLKSEKISKECINPTGTFAAMNKCGIPEIWLLRYKLMETNSINFEKSDLEIARKFKDAGMSDDHKL